MEPKRNEENLAEKNLIGLRSILQYGGIWKSAVINWFAGISLVGSLIAALTFNINTYSYINEVIKLLIQLVPSLLGFTIAGYSFLMAFIPQRLMDRISEPLKDSRISLYQRITSSLAFNIFQHAVILIVSYIVYLTIFIQEDNKLSFEKTSFTEFINEAGFVLVNVLLFVALAVIIQIIASSFNLAQLYHYDVNKQKLDEKNRKKLDDIYG
jgi:hypothetical protein